MNQNQRQQNIGAQQPRGGEVIPFAGSNPLGLPSPREWEMIKDMSAAAARSGFLPKGVTPEGAAIIAIKARELKLPLMVGFSHIFVVNGKPAMSAELIQAQARKNLPGLNFNILETNNEKCVVEGKRPEKDSKPVTLAFTIEDARRANLLGKDVWKQYPAAMLRSRAITALLRILCPDALMGVSYTPEELGANVDEDGNIIETTSRPIDPEAKVKEEVSEDLSKARTEETKQTTEPSFVDPETASKMKAEFQKISLLMTELQISKEDLRAEIFEEYGVDDAKKLSLEQLKGVVLMLEKECDARKQGKPETEMKQEAQPAFAPWEQEIPGGQIGG